MTPATIQRETPRPLRAAGTTGRAAARDRARGSPAAAGSIDGGSVAGPAPAGGIGSAAGSDRLGGLRIGGRDGFDRGRIASGPPGSAAARGSGRGRGGRRLRRGRGLGGGSRRLGGDGGGTGQPGDEGRRRARLALVTGVRPGGPADDRRRGWCDRRLELGDRAEDGQTGRTGDRPGGRVGGHDREAPIALERLPGEEPEVHPRGGDPGARRNDQGDLRIGRSADPCRGGGDLVVDVEVEDGGHRQTFIARRTRRRAMSRGSSADWSSIAWRASPSGVTSC